jgi:hypothetical protein
MPVFRSLAIMMHTAVSHPGHVGWEILPPTQMPPWRRRGEDRDRPYRGPARRQ